MDKPALRKYMNARLKLVSNWKEASFSACEHVLLHPAYRQANTIFCYIAMKEELDPSYIVYKAKKAGKRVVFPVCRNKTLMEAYLPWDEDAIVPGAYGILAPDISRSDLIAPDEIDLIIVPGLAFDAMGGRLGRGAGYYDRFFSRTDAYRLGFCMDIQFVENVPMSEHDVRMHALITQNGNIHIDQRQS